MSGYYPIAGPIPAGARIDPSAVLDELALVRRALLDLRPVWRQAGTIMRRSFAANFREGGRPDKWAPLAPNTVAAKQHFGAALGFPYASAQGIRRVRRLRQISNGIYARSLSNILIAGGQLRDSYVQKNGDHISRVSHQGFEEGSDHWLAPIHEYGTDPYEIRAKVTGGRLRFMTVQGFRSPRTVHHPGLPARPVGIMQEEDQAAILDLMERHLG